MVGFAGLLALTAIATQVSAATWYVKAAADSGGDGSKNHPFSSLADVQAASSPGDTIYIRQSPAQDLLDGSIALKADQQLIGLGPDVTTASVNAAAARITNSAGGPIVLLATGNEISGIHFQPSSGPAIFNNFQDFSGAYIHDNLFSEIPGSTPFAYNISMVSFAGNIDNVSVQDNVFRDSNFMGSIQAAQLGNSTGEFEFEGNVFENMNQRSYALVSSGIGSLKATIMDSVSTNIGVGNANADSILLQVMVASTMDVVIDNYQYDNPAQVGNISNTGLEIFLPPDSDGSQVTLEIKDSVFANAVTEAIQLNNFGSNNIMDVAIRNTRIVDANPQQIQIVSGFSGAIAMVSEFSGDFFGTPISNSGSQSSLLLENSDITGSTEYAVALIDAGDDGFTATIDLGGGDLGSVGQNRILDNAAGDIAIEALDGIGGYNWWGGDAPQIDTFNGATFDAYPELLADPRP